MLVLSNERLSCPRGQNFASAAGIETFSPVSHTLFDPADVIARVSPCFSCLVSS